jgi:HEPN domain-containing protein
MSGTDREDIREEILAWLRVAESDQRVARLCLNADPPLRDAAAYHCQQAAEKLLKGFLVKAGSHVSKTHDLDARADLVRGHYPAIDDLLTPLPDWTTWSTAYRYPGEGGPQPEPSVEELTRALDFIGRLEATLRSLAPP